MLAEKIRRIACGVMVCAFVLAGAWPLAASAQEVDYRRALKLISDKLNQRFPHLEGIVVAIKGGDLYLSFEKKSRVSQGVKLSVYRKGAPFRHPVTGVVLGTLEEEIGQAEIVEVRPTFAVARMIRLTPGRDLVPRVKDTVRLSSAKIRIAVLPFLNKTKEPLSTEVLTRELSRSLLSSGRFDVYDVDRLQVWLLENAIASDEVLKGRNAIRLRNHIRADLALENTIRDLRGKKIITSRLLSLTTRKELFKAVAIADELPFEQRAPREQALRRGEGGRGVSPANSSFVLDRQGVPGSRGGVSSYVFNNVEFRGVSVADVNGDGKKEVLVITSTQLIVYQLDAGRMREVGRLNEGVGNDFRWIDTADMNGNGRPEVYIANFRSDTLFSIVLEMKGREFRKLVTNKQVFFRLIRVRRPDPRVKIPDADAYLLLGQAQGMDEIFAGPINRYRWAGNRLRVSAPYLLPSNLTILGFGLWDLDKDGSLDVIEIGKDDHLRIYSRRGGVRYTSSGYYGAPALKFYNTDNAAKSDDAVLNGADMAIRSRVLVQDVDGDGIDEVLVIANEYGASRLAPGLGLSGGQLVSLIWDGSGLSEVWRSKKLGIGIVDFALGDADNDGVDDLVLVTSEPSSFSGERSQIVVYKIKG